VLEEIESAFMITCRIESLSGHRHNRAMRSVLFMFLFVFCMPLLLLAVTACEPMIYDVSKYQNDPDKKTVNIDEHTVFVSPQMGGYAAWGSGTDKWAKYRQRRGIELISKCRIDKVLSKPTDNVTYATVNC